MALAKPAPGTLNLVDGRLVPARVGRTSGRSRSDNARSDECPLGTSGPPTLGRPIYGWFTEGFDTLDLQEAKALLQALED